MTPGAKETLRKWAETALTVQDACNLSGVVRSWSGGLEELWAVARVLGEGTDWVNEHPINKLFADKVAQLAGVQGTGGLEVIQAYSECKALAAGETYRVTRA